MLEEPFLVFCEGVASSTSLIVLDLRNNQISHHGAAELATALRRNTTLRRLGNMLPLTFHSILVVVSYLYHLPSIHY